jgi:hypothetical protein
VASPDGKDGESSPAVLPPGLISWALVLGACGLIAGIFGPAMLDPEVPQGSLATVIITGPIALLFGLLLGKVEQRSG